MIKGSPKIKVKDEDTISSRLEYGSLVVPVPVMRTGIMNKYNGPITGPKVVDKAKLGATIVMPGELVVNRRHAPAVEKYLKQHDITLPLAPSK